MNAIDTIGSQEVRRLVQFRAKPGADLLAAIEEAVAIQNVRAGVIVSGLGALRRAVFRNLKQFPAAYPVQPRHRLYLEIEQPMELVSLGGWIAPRADDGVEIHAHFSASMVAGQTVVTLGGHLTRGTICGIKVAVAILAVESEAVAVEMDPQTKTWDILFGHNPCVRCTEATQASKPPE